MYINFKQLGTNLQRGDLELLCAIKQGETEYLITNSWYEALARFKELDFITEVKGKKKDDHPYKALRLTDKAKKLLVSISYEGAIDDEAEALGDWLIALYKRREGGIIKNKIESKRRLQWFKTITGISGNKLALLLKAFLTDTYNSTTGDSIQDFMSSNPRGVLNNMLDNVCWSPDSIWDKHKTLEKSPLYNYYSDNQEYIHKIWKDNNLL